MRKLDSAYRARLDALVGVLIYHDARGPGHVKGVQRYLPPHRLAVLYRDGKGCACQGDYHIACTANGRL